MIGDNPKADIIGAKELGAITFQKIHSKVNIGESTFEPDYTFRNYFSFLKKVKKFLSNNSFD